MVEVIDVQLGDGRSVRVHDSGGGGAATLLWHHGSPQTGALLDPLLAAARARGIRLLSYARPSYGGSSPHRGRDVSSAGSDVAQVVDALGIERFAVMGASGGGPHALACPAALPDRVTGVVCLAGLAPYTESFDWWTGIVAPGGLRAAAEGRTARERFAETDDFDENCFVAADWGALADEWQSLGEDASRAGTEGTEGLIDDDLAFVAEWGFDVAQLDTPVLLVHGSLDRVNPPAHSQWLLQHCRSSELWVRPLDGHVSVLSASPVAMDWLLAHGGCS